MKGKSFLVALLAGAAALPMSANAVLVFDTWSTNENGTGNYILTVTENGDFFDLSLTVNPWNAEALGLFIDLGDVTVSDASFNSVSPAGQISLIGTDTTSNDCGSGCNLNGLNPTLADPDDEWEWVFRLGEQGFDSIQSFGLSIARNGATESNWAFVGIRAQQLCSGDATLPNETCNGSDKSVGTGTVVPPPTTVPEPGSLALLGAGLLGLGLVRRRRRS